MQDLIDLYEWQGPLFPMNAKDSGKKKEQLLDDDEYVSEIKFDGARYLSIGGRFFSRVASVKDGMPSERTENVPHLTKILSQVPGLILDGEVYYPGKKSNHVTSIMGCAPEKAIDRQKGEYGWIRYVIYDILMWNNQMITDWPWINRRKLLQEVYKNYVLPIDGAQEFLDLSQISIRDKKRELLAYANENDLEGIMLKNINAAYYPGARPTNVWFKVKQEITYDVVVIGYDEGKGKYAGMVGAVRFGLYKDGVLTECGKCSGMTDELRGQLTTYPDAFKGRVMEIEAMERTEKGMFRHPRFLQFRAPEDKDAKMCTWDNA
jgi:ATP-dependent DNA ligase